MRWTAKEQEDKIRKLITLSNKLVKRIEKLEAEVESHKRIIDYRVCDPKRGNFS